MSAPNYAALKAALTTTYSSQTDAQIVAALNAATVTQAVDVSTQAVLNYLGVNGLLPTVRGWANVAPTPPASGLSAAQIQGAQVAAQTFGITAQTPSEWPTLKMSDPTTNEQITGMVDALVTGGLLPQANATAILGMGVVTVSQASLWGWENGIYENDLIAARAMP